MKYEAATLSYDKYASLSVAPETLTTNASKLENGQYQGKDENKQIYVYYSSTEVNVLTEEFILDFSNFISAIGGNLGMFIGFSFLGFFSWFYDMVDRLCNRININKYLYLE